MNMGEGDVEKQMGRMRAIYDSMTAKERKNTDLLDGTRRRRIAARRGRAAERGRPVHQAVRDEPRHDARRRRHERQARLA